jgi:hypothetical protein
VQQSCFGLGVPSPFVKLRGDLHKRARDILKTCDFSSVQVTHFDPRAPSHCFLGPTLLSPFPNMSIYRHRPFLAFVSQVVRHSNLWPDLSSRIPSLIFKHSRTIFRAKARQPVNSICRPSPSSQPSPSIATKIQGPKVRQPVNSICRHQSRHPPSTGTTVPIPKAHRATLPTNSAFRSPVAPRCNK